MAIYEGQNFGSDGPGIVIVHTENGSYNLQSGFDDPELPSHSPDGFQAGFNGSGPAQLAAAILNDIYDHHTANRHYQEFKQCVVSKINRDSWQLNEETVTEWLSELRFQSGKVD